MTVVSMSYLLEAGVHFGHQTRRWNPKMREYIFTSRDDIYIIDLQKTAKMIEVAYAELKKIAESGKKVLFVGTRKQAQDATRDEAVRSKSFYVTERWLGGTLTNFRTIRRRVKRLEDIEKMEADGTFALLPKKEVIGLRKEYEKLNKLLCGIREMNELPGAIFIVDPTKEDIAIREAHRLHIPVFGIVDTNCDPDVVDYVIPGNDDAIRAVKLIIGVMANAIVEASGGELVNYVNEADSNEKEIMEKAVESVKKREDHRREQTPDRRNNYNNNNNNRNFRRDYRDSRESRETKEVKEEVKVEPIVEVKEEPVKEVKEVAVKVEKAEKKDLAELTVAELRDLAKAKEVKGYSTMKKAELIDALN